MTHWVSEKFVRLGILVSLGICYSLVGSDIQGFFGNPQP